MLQLCRTVSVTVKTAACSLANRPCPLAGCTMLLPLLAEFLGPSPSGHGACYMSKKKKPNKLADIRHVRLQISGILSDSLVALASIKYF